jgi:hypothetical protein
MFKSLVVFYLAFIVFIIISAKYNSEEVSKEYYDLLNVDCRHYHNRLEENGFYYYRDFKKNNLARRHDYDLKGLIKGRVNNNSLEIVYLTNISLRDTLRGKRKKRLRKIPLKDDVIKLQGKITPALYSKVDSVFNEYFIDYIYLRQLKIRNDFAYGKTTMAFQMLSKDLDAFRKLLTSQISVQEKKMFLKIYNRYFLIIKIAVEETEIEDLLNLLIKQVFYLQKNYHSEKSSKFISKMKYYDLSI